MQTADLWSRLRKWARETHGWDGRLGMKAEMRMPVSATIGPHTGYGHTTNQAINNLADGLIEDGWPDDREDCELCEAEGEVLQGASIHSTGRPRLVECPDCGGTGYAR